MRWQPYLREEQGQTVQPEQTNQMSDEEYDSYDTQDAYFDSVESFTLNTIKRYPELQSIYHTTGGWTSLNSEGKKVHVSVHGVRMF